MNQATIYIFQGGKSVKVKAKEEQETYVVLCYGDDLAGARRDWPDAPEVGITEPLEP